MKHFFNAVKQRPLIVLMMALACLPLVIYEQYSSVVQKVGSFSLLFGQNFMNTVSDIADGIKITASSPAIMVLSVIVAILVLLALSFILGVYFGGYNQTLYLAVNDIPKKRGDFKQAINRYYIKLTFYFLFLIISMFLMMGMLLFSTVPFFTLLNMFLAGDSAAIFMMLIVAVLTILFDYFALIFYTMYMSYMLPALIAFKKGGVIVSFKMTNGYCWYLMPRTTFFLLLLLLDKIIMLQMGFGVAKGGHTLLCIVINWILTSAILIGYVYYVFNTFSIMKDDMFNTTDKE